MTAPRDASAACSSAMLPRSITIPALRKNASSSHWSVATWQSLPWAGEGHHLPRARRRGWRNPPCVAREASSRRSSEARLRSTPLARRRRPCGLSAACSAAASSLDAWPARPPRPPSPERREQGGEPRGGVGERDGRAGVEARLLAGEHEEAGADDGAEAEEGEVDPGQAAAQRVIALGEQSPGLDGVGGAGDHAVAQTRDGGRERAAVGAPALERRLREKSAVPSDPIASGRLHLPIDVVALDYGAAMGGNPSLYLF